MLGRRHRCKHPSSSLRDGPRRNGAKNDESRPRANGNRLSRGPATGRSAQRLGALASPRVACQPPILQAFSTERVTAVVWVNAYVRRRFGQLEHVCGHFRSLPT